VQGDVWKAVLPNSFFGSFNPYSDTIHGDWFNPLGGNITRAPSTWTVTG